jgi:YegS/Rv2252/BmrU family lipid kinase
MKHCFIINPASGKSTTKEGLEKRIMETCDKLKAQGYVLETECVGDAQRLVKSFYDEHDTEDEIRFYACGGDGTLCEVVNGVMALENRDNVSVGVIPVGTGNDFVRNFEPKELFFDIEAQLCGETVKIDLIKCNDFYAVNMINIGFDCQVVVKTSQYKHSKLIPSKMAYIAGLVVTLIKKPGVCMRVSTDGGEASEKKLLLTTFANGQFCGGGFHSNPKADLCDGHLDTLFVNNITRTKFISIVGDYKKGTHITPKFDKVLKNLKAEVYDIAFDEPTNISVDGEIVKVDGVRLCCERGALSFVMPRGIECISVQKATEKESATV